MLTILGPVLAVWASEIRQRGRQAHDRQEWVFRTLMTTRSTRMSLDHVSALNHIDFAFPQNKHPQIADAWGLYLDHLNKGPGDTQESLNRWLDGGDNLLADLIHIMASDLSVPFPKTSIKRAAYYPKVHWDTEMQLNEIRELLLQLLKNERSLYVTTSS
ncbi:MAG: DUF6680 family protein [Steroidobacteraceae bacterium]